MADLDLETGVPSEGDSERARRRRRREASSSERESTPKSEAKLESEVRTQLSRAFDSLAKNREAAGDEELATAVREETEPMTEGFVQLTSSVTVLRMPLIILLNVIITLLAFGRVGGILVGRWMERRERHAHEAAVAAGGVEYDQNDVAYQVNEYGAVAQ